MVFFQHHIADLSLFELESTHGICPECVQGLYHEFDIEQTPWGPKIVATVPPLFPFLVKCLDRETGFFNSLHSWP